MRRRDLFWAENLARTTSGSKHQTVRFFPFRRKHAIAHGIDKVVVDSLSLPRYSLMLEPPISLAPYDTSCSRMRKISLHGLGQAHQMRDRQVRYMFLS